VNISAEIEFAGQDGMAAPVAREKGYFATFESAADVGVGGSAEWRFDANFLDFAEPGHGVQPAPADDSDLSLWQYPSKTFQIRKVKPVIIQDTHSVQPQWRPRDSRYNFPMRFSGVAFALLALCSFGIAQGKPALAPQSVTVPLTIDHNRALIDADVRFADGTTQHVRAVVDNGNPNLQISEQLATSASKGSAASVSCDGQICFVDPPVEMTVGGMTIILGGRIPGAGMKATIMRDSTISGVPPGLKAQINLPSIVLRRYDVLIDFPEHKFTIGAPGSIHFQGESAKGAVNADNGLIQVPSRIDNKKYNLALDLGLSISFLSPELFDKLAAAHPDWPHMTGAVGSANTGSGEEETKWKVIRVDRVQYGPAFLTNIAFVEQSRETINVFANRASIAATGWLGASALQNFRVGLDYGHSTVYFEVGRTSTFPDFDVVGLILRPTISGGFTILGVADVDGKPSVPVGPDGVQPGDSLVAVNDISVLTSTMGQVWALLGGMPGQERRLTIRRSGKEFIVTAQVQHFLGEVPDEKERKQKRNKQ
jgi:hypothetical protein